MCNCEYKMRWQSFTKCFPMKTKLICITTLVALIYLISSYALLEHASFNSTEINNNVRSANKSVKLQNVIVHLDLKGSPPKLSYLESILPKLQILGATGLLIEYEDMFPYEGKLVNLSARNCYERNKLQKFLTLAVHVGFDIIPLVQTFGHLEYALKLPEFRNLREMLQFPDSICPSKYGSLLLIREMLKQVIEFHQNVAPLKYLHIGCDEVFHINKCQQCKLRNQTNTKMYLSHVRTVTDIVKAFSTNTTVLIWDDMFRKILVNVWDSTKHPAAELVYWDYEPDIKVSHINLMKYHKTFKNIWIASAFKGADGRTKTFPDMIHRFSNHFSWMNFISDYKFGGEDNVFEFRGIILTGWSRYSHLDPPCELLPTSLPSLYLSLLLIKRFQDGVSSEEYNVADVFDKYLNDNLTHSLHCSGFLNLEYIDTSQCYFDGNELYLLLKHWDITKGDILNAINDDENGLYSVDYYSKSKNVNINNLQRNIDWTNDSLNQIEHLKVEVVKALSHYYEMDFVSEYVNFKFYNTQKILRDLFKSLNSMLKIKSWSRRPYS